MAATLVRSLRADRVSGLRLRDVCWADPSTSISDVLQCMSDRRTGCVLVMRDGALLGIFTERDFVNRVAAQFRDPAAVAIEQVMTPVPATVHQSDSVFTAIERMSQGPYRHLPVLDDNGNPVGVLSVKEVMNYLVEYFPAQVYNLPPTLDVQQPAREGA